MLRWLGWVGQKCPKTIFLDGNSKGAQNDQKNLAKKEIMSYTFQKSHCLLCNTVTTLYDYISPRDWNFLPTCEEFNFKKHQESESTSQIVIFQFFQYCAGGAALSLNLEPQGVDNLYRNIKTYHTYSTQSILIKWSKLCYILDFYLADGI